MGSTERLGGEVDKERPTPMTIILEVIPCGEIAFTEIVQLSY